MSDSDCNHLREKGWRRKLTAAEEAQLQAHPEARADWEMDARLTEAISRLPDAPVPSNFTARVMQAVERELADGKRPKRPVSKWSLRLLLPKVAAMAVLLGTGLFTYHEYTAQKKQAEVAEGVKMVSGVQSLPSPEVLQDFETIRQLPSGRASGPDPELIKLNQDLLALDK